MKIYTKTGDKGKTRLVGGCLVSKGDLRIESYGSVDELNSSLGVIATELIGQAAFAETRDILLRIQNELFNLGSLLACEDPALLLKLPPLGENHVKKLETEIDAMTADLPELRDFILPGGHRLSALAHVSRTLCRRAERNTVRLFEQHPEVEIGMVYLNRLSDFLFTLARFFNLKLGVKDQLWTK